MTENMIKSIQWERAKGELRAAVVATGCTDALTGVQQEARQKQYQEFDRRVEQFIKEIEDEGLCELYMTRTTMDLSRANATGCFGLSM